MFPMSFLQERRRQLAAQQENQGESFQAQDLFDEDDDDEEGSSGATTEEEWPIEELLSLINMLHLDEHEQEGRHEVGTYAHLLSVRNSLRWG